MEKRGTLLHLQELFFYLLIFCIPFQVGLHFWPSFSYVDGIRIDYLSPTLHLSDILIILLFIFTIGNRNFSQAIHRAQKNKIMVLFILELLILFIFSRIPLAHLFGLVKLAEFIFLGWYISIHINKQNIKTATIIIALGASIVSVMAIAQFFLQHSIGGPFYFLGERTFNSSTIGIATMQIRDTFLLRPYATFPHPNVLAFFLLFAATLGIRGVLYFKNLKIKLFLSFSLILIHSAILLTYSRVILLLYALMILYFVLTYWKHGKKIVIPILLCSIGIGLFVGSSLVSRFLNEAGFTRDLYYRVDLVKIYFEIAKNNPLTGIGINNHFVFQSPLQKTLTPTLFQPVHNIYLLVFVQTGIIGLLITFFGIYKTLLRLKIKIKTKNLEEKSFYEMVQILLISVLFVGIFDHFLFSLQQGQIIFAVIIGFAWAKFKE